MHETEVWNGSMEPKNQYQPEFVSPPGETLADVLDDRGLTPSDLALRMGLPTTRIHAILRGDAVIDPELAAELERILSVPAGFWLARELRYRTSVEQRNGQLGP